MIAVRVRLIAVMFFLIGAALGCNKTQSVGLWERHCEACHDGKTVLNGRIVASREQIKEKYKTLDEFANACTNSPVCMNIVKHEEKLLIKVGTEIGIKKGN